MTRIPDHPLVIAVDSSTTSSKAIIVDATGRVLAQGKHEIELHSPRSGWYEHNPADWWESTEASIADAVGQLDDEQRAAITAMAITHQRESFAPFTEDGQALRPGILWLDGRASKQILAYGSDEIHALSGKPADITPGLYKMAWVKENEPEALTNAHKVSDVHGYLVWNLTGRWCTSVACADSLGLFDISRLTWSDTLLDTAGVTREQMNDLVNPGEFIANVKPEIRERWGLEQDLPVIAGCGDGRAAGIGAGVVEPGCGGLLTLPYWQAVQSPYWDPIARGAFIGWRGSHDRAAMYRSILEGLRIEMARDIDAMQASTGVPVTRIGAMGGGTRSPLWRQIMTDATGRPITACAEDEIAALGAAIIAMASTGAHGDTTIPTAAKAMARFGDTTEPDPATHGRYSEAAAIQGEIYQASSPSWTASRASRRSTPWRCQRAPRTDAGSARQSPQSRRRRRRAMSTITVLGAGAMGSALCTPVARAGWDVRLWGTWLDDHLLDALEAGRPHPRTNAPLPSSVALFRSDDLEAALDSADVVVMAVASVGVPRVTEMALDGITRARALWLTSKGFTPDAEGRVQLLPDAIRRIAGDRGLPPIVAIAGPVKANECGVEEPTATIFGCRDLAVAQEFARMARTDRYAIALGVADGLEERTGVPHHNLKAAAFARGRGDVPARPNPGSPARDGLRPGRRRRPRGDRAVRPQQGLRHAPRPGRGRGPGP